MKEKFNKTDGNLFWNLDNTVLALQVNPNFYLLKFKSSDPHKPKTMR